MYIISAVMHRTILLLTAVLSGVIASSAADPSGQWVAQVPGRQGNTLETTFNLKASGDKLTGTTENQFGSRDISDGKVSGDNISFTVHLEFGGNEVTFLYSGVVSANEIKFTRERKGGDLGPPKVEFVAKKKN